MTLEFIKTIRPQIIKKLKEVLDPEIGLNVVDLGLIYNVYEDENRVLIEFTTTTPGCPMRRLIHQSVQEAVDDIEQTGKSEIRMVMEPDWTPEMITPGLNLFAPPDK